MNENEARVFYKEQFQLFKEILDLSIPDSQFAEEIIEQVGKPFTTVLELGAGNGLLARSLSAFNKKITTVELVPEMVEFAKKYNSSNITALCGSFYDIDLSNTFDTILYMDGFGVGTDKEQLALLKRIHDWLNDDGVALIDIYQPEYWKKVNGNKMMPFPNSNVSRIYGYDHTFNRMTDTWWEEDAPEIRYIQSLACYSLDEVYDLCRRANLNVTAYFPGGAMDYENWQFNEVVALSKALSYRIKVKKA